MDASSPASSTLTVAPASLSQRQCWLYDRLYGRDGSYNIPLGVRLVGSLDRRALERSLNEIIRRHEVLRTTLIQEDEEVLQVIADDLVIALPLVAVDDRNRLAALEWVRTQVRADGSEPFDLQRGPLLRTALYRLAPDDHILTIVFHHAVFDGWSIGVLLEELGALYTAFSEGRPSPLPHLDIQFGDFASWQREQLDNDALEPALTYWRDQLSGAPAFIDLPTDRPRQRIGGRQGHLLSGLASPALQHAVAQLSRREGVTQFTVLAATFALLLHRYSGQDDLLMAMPVAGRTRQELEPLIGFFVNTVLLRSRLRGDPTIREWLAQVKTAVLDAQNYQEAPFEKVAEIVRIRPGGGELPLLQVMLAFQSATPEPSAFGGLTVSLFWVHNGTAKFELFLNVVEDSSGLKYELETDRDLFDQATTAQWLQHFEVLLGSMAASPSHHRLSDVTLLRDDERQRLLAHGTGTRAAYPRDQSLATVFEAQARQTPDAIAATCDGQQLSYRDLNRRANRVARLLKARGIGVDVLVGVALDRSLDLLVALLAIAKAGSAYVPLDLAYPAERLAFILADSGAPLVITLRRTAAELPLGPRLELDDETLGIGQLADDDSSPQAGADELAYVMYTSGSTGQPKGVAVSHRAVVRLVLGTDYVAWSEVRAILHMSPVSFDASTFEIWGALLNGARCVLMSNRHLSLEVLAFTLQSERVDCLWLTSALFNEVVDTDPGMLAGVRQLVAGGEALSVAHVRRALAALPDTRLINGYGPTETTTFACCFPIPRTLDSAVRSIPLGRPIANTQAYILDDRGALVPPGVTGELYLGGDGVAREYWHQSELTAARFVPDPFSDRPGARLYRTGDLVRWLPEATIEFLGRRDRQVKLRGFRIEPGEIEHALRSTPDISDAVVEIRSDDGGPRLVAYWVPTGDGDLDGTVVRDRLKGRLPAYMIPSEFVRLSHVPRTVNGKVDRERLPAPPAAVSHREALSPPKDEVEEKLLVIWSSVLKADGLGTRDHFFELGGHSLSAARLFVQIERAFGVSLPLSILFEAPTVEQLAARIRERRAANTSSLIVVATTPGPPLVYVHSIGGDVLECRGMARWLGADQGVVGVHAILTDQVADIYQSIEATAARYVSDLRRLQPVGPYYLAGWSSGGITVFEMAQQLRAAGEQIALLAIVDAAPMTIGPLSDGSVLKDVLRLLANVPRWIRDDMFVSDPSAVLQRTRQKIALLSRKVMTRLSRAAKAHVPQIRDVVNFPQGSRNWETYVERHYNAIGQYVPRPYDGKITVLKARTHPLMWIHDSDVVWKRLSADVDVHVIPGTHLTIVGEKNMPALCIALKAAIAKARAAAGT